MVYTQQGSKNPHCLYGYKLQLLIIFQQVRLCGFHESYKLKQAALPVSLSAVTIQVWFRDKTFHLQSDLGSRRHHHKRIFSCCWKVQQALHLKRSDMFFFFFSQSVELSLKLSIFEDVNLLKTVTLILSESSSLREKYLCCCTDDHHILCIYILTNSTADISPMTFQKFVMWTTTRLFLCPIKQNVACSGIGL